MTTPATSPRPYPQLQPSDRLRVRAGFGLDENALECLARVYSPGLQIRAVRDAGAASTVGSSRIGGLPDLSPDAAWPLFARRPMAFLAQFNLAEVASRCPDSLLPPTGLLSFFRAFDDEGDYPMWYDPESRPDTSRVLYSPDIEELTQAPRPLKLRSTSPACRLELAATNSLPSLRDWRWLISGLADSQRGAVERLQMNSELEPETHQLAGYPDYDLDRMALSAELMSGGKDQFEGFDSQSPEGRKLIEATTEWITLAHFVCCRAADWDWGAGGSLGFMIRESDMRAARFDRVIAATRR